MNIIGIDLGTTNSAVGIWRENQVNLIPNKMGNMLTPSVVYIGYDGIVQVGDGAKEHLITKANNTASVFKRYMGTDYKFKLGNKHYSAIELSSFVLKSLKEDAEHFLGHEVKRAVISVPAYFNDIQRRATITAGELAGLKIEKLINEPTAASIAYNIQEKQDYTKTIVLDLGGGTFDVSLMEYFDGVLEVHASAGDNFLGGEDFTNLLIDIYYALGKIDKKSLKAEELEIVRTHIESAKKSFNDNHIVTIEPIISAQKETIKLDKNEFIKKAQPLLDKIIHPIETSIRDSKLKLSDLNDVILVGGATRMDFLRMMIGKMFRRIPSCRFDPDLIVAIGATIQAGLKANDKDLQDVVLTDVSPYTLGVGTYNENDTIGKYGTLFLPIIERNTVVPCSKIQLLSTVADNQTEIYLGIYQGENRLTKFNIELGELTLKVPKNKKGEESISVRFSYDTNGILEVDAEVMSTKEKHNKVIISNSSSLDEKEIQTSREKLSKLKFHPREDEINLLLIARAEKMFSARIGIERDEIEQKIRWFESVLERQDAKEIGYARDEFVKFLDFTEKDTIF